MAWLRETNLVYALHQLRLLSSDVRLNIQVVSGHQRIGAENVTGTDQNGAKYI